MRLSDAEKGPHHRMREVSELRIQYQCEYRFHLKQKFRDSHADASIAGAKLHQRMSTQADSQHVENTEHRLAPLLIFVVTLIAGFLWIFG
jgi:hypothetical protein